MSMAIWTPRASREAWAGAAVSACLRAALLAAAVVLCVAMPSHAAVPANGALAPAGGQLVIGSTVTLTASYADADGASDISRAVVLLNTTLSAVNASDLYYDAVANKLWLRNDASSAWVGGYAPGSPNTIENASIKVFCAATSATPSGQTLTVSWSVQLKAAVAGKTLRSWLWVEDKSAGSPGWSEKSPYTAVLSATAPANQSITPASGAVTIGTGLTIQAAYSDPNGSSDIVGAYMLLNTAIQGANAVYLFYDATADRLYLRNDANSQWLGGVAPGSAGTIENGAVIVDAAQTTVVENGADLVVNWRVTLKPTLAGRALKGWLYVIDAGNSKDGWDELASLTPTIVNEKPVNSSISPSSGSVTAAVATTFNAVYTDADGYNNIANCYLLLNSAVSGAGAFYVWFDAVNNMLWLRNDANTAWLGGYAPGSANVIENSVGKLYCAQTSALGDQTTLTLSLRTEFKTAAAGRALKEYLYVTDKGGLNDGWDQLGTVSVSVPGPINQSVSPDGGDFPVGETVTFTATYTHPGGSSKIGKAYLLLNTSLSGNNAIYVYYDQKTNRLYLRNDANTAWVGGLAPGAINVIQNSQAWVDCEFTSVSASGNTLTIAWSIYIKPAAPASNVRGWMYVSDTSTPALTDGWDEMAVFGGSRRPANLSLDPASGTVYAGVKTTLTAKHTDADGASDIASAYLLVNTSLSSVGACSLWYDGAANKLYLRNDASTAWLGGVTPGAAQTIENSQCRVYCQETSAVGSGPELTVAWRVQFKNTMLGKALKSWLFCSDLSSLTDGWDQMGTLAVATAPNLAPANVSLAEEGTLAVGNSVTFTSVHSDLNGASDIDSVYFLLNETANGANACYLRYDAVAGKLYLRNDANDDWLGGFAPGSGSAIENSTVRLFCSSTSVMLSGESLSVTWSVQFLPPMAGRSPRGWLYVLDKAGQADGWDDNGVFAFSSYVNQAPANVSLSPPTGNLNIGASQTLTAVYSDPNGYANIRSALLLLNNTSSGANGVLCWYDAAENKLYLRDDADAAWIGGFAPGSANTIENSRAKLYCATTSIGSADQTLTIGWRIEPKIAMAGRNVSGWLYATDAGGLTDGYDALAAYTIPAPLNLTPTCESLTPATGSLVSDGQVKKAYKGLFSDSNGVTDLAECYLLINSSLSQTNGIYVRYDANNNRLYLRNDANTAWLGGYAPGTDIVISNSRAKLYCVHSTVTTTDKLEVSWVLEFMNLPDSNYAITHWGWTSVTDDSSATEAFKQLGAYSVVKVDLPPPPG